ncbi:MAG: MBL fold metallo-hydrolase [Dongiaceae bacterium]
MTAVTKVTVLGCGGSGGVPMIGPNWGNCNPDNPKNRRRRVSVLVEHPQAKILLDTSPDLRMQMLDAGINKIDAILYTHDHADHTQGIDDVRFLKPSSGSAIDVYAATETLTSLTQRFAYIFQQDTKGSGHLYKPFLTPHQVDIPSRFRINGIEIDAFEQEHGFGTVTTGYRIGKMAYSTDAVNLPDYAFDLLQGLDLWIVDCLRFEPHGTHAHFDKAMNWIERIKPKHAVLTHLNHQVDYDVIRDRCPPGVEPGYDGLTIEIGA